MKINVFIIGCSIIMLCLVSGCQTRQTAIVSDDNLTPRMKSRAAELKSIMAGSAGFGVYIDEASRKVYAEKPAILASRCKMFGITDVYMTVSPERFEDDEIYAGQLRSLAIQMKQHNIRLWIILDKVSFFTWADKLGKPDEDEITRELVEDMVGITGDEIAEKGRIAGILLVVNPEKINNSNPDLPVNLLYSWGKGKFGIGNDNDMIMNYSFKVIRAVTGYASKTPVILAVPHTLHDKKAEGKLSRGSINEFLNHSEQIIITGFTSKFKQVRLRAEAELASAQKPDSINICVKMDTDAINGNAYGEAINSKGWAYTMRGFKYLIRRMEKYPSFRGITIYDYAGLERTWEFSD